MIKIAGIKYTSQSVPQQDVLLNGGLNSSAGPLGLQNNESSDLSNIDFDRFGSILKRNGYTALNTASLNAGADSNGLYWFEYETGGSLARKAINIGGSKIYKMDDLDGTWDNITSATGITITTGKFCDFATFQNRLFITNGNDAPFNWDINRCTGISLAEIPATLTKAKYVELFNNYLFYGNCILSDGNHTSRIYWCDLKNSKVWGANSFIDIALNDGQEITGLKTLSDRLVVYKNRSIYNVFFTGDATTPFILPGGGKSNSSVGCAAPFSIQEVMNGHVFLSHDGLYFYDGNNSTKLSDKITTTLMGYNTANFSSARSMNQKSKSRYWIALQASGASENNRVIIWDYYHHAFSQYIGFNPGAMSIFYVGGTDERPYFADYGGYTYRADTGLDDYLLNVQTAINAYYYTNWRSYGDLIDKKGIAHATIYHRISSSLLKFAYAYDLEESDSYSQSIDLSTSGDTYGTGSYGTATYASSGGLVKRVDLTGRGRVVRFKFQNNVKGETFRIDGFGTLPHLETVA